MNKEEELSKVIDRSKFVLSADKKEVYILGELSGEELQRFSEKVNELGLKLVPKYPDEAVVLDEESFKRDAIKVGTKIKIRAKVIDVSMFNPVLFFCEEGDKIHFISDTITRCIEHGEPTKRSIVRNVLKCQINGSWVYVIAPSEHDFRVGDEFEAEGFIINYKIKDGIKRAIFVNADRIWPVEKEVKITEDFLTKIKSMKGLKEEIYLPDIRGTRFEKVLVPKLPLYYSNKAVCSGLFPPQLKLLVMALNFQHDYFTSYRGLAMILFGDQSVGKTKIGEVIVKNMGGGDFTGDVSRARLFGGYDSRANTVVRGEIFNYHVSFLDEVHNVLAYQNSDLNRRLRNWLSTGKVKVQVGTSSTSAIEQEYHGGIYMASNYPSLQGEQFLEYYSDAGEPQDLYSAIYSKLFNDPFYSRLIVVHLTLMDRRHNELKYGEELHKIASDWGYGTALTREERYEILQYIELVRSHKPKITDEYKKIRSRYFNVFMESPYYDPKNEEIIEKLAYVMAKMELAEEVREEHLRIAYGLWNWSRMTIFRMADMVIDFKTGEFVRDREVFNKIAVSSEVNRIIPALMRYKHKMESLGTLISLYHFSREEGIPVKTLMLAERIGWKIIRYERDASIFSEYLVEVSEDFLRILKKVRDEARERAKKSMITYELDAVEYLITCLVQLLNKKKKKGGEEENVS